MKYWLLKSEGDCYSIDDLGHDGTTSWTGIRNYQARNFMRDDMRVGDLALFYHSNSHPSGVYGVARVVSKAHADLTQFDKKDEHYDSKASQEKPIWLAVDVSFKEKFKIPISLETIKSDPALEGMLVRVRGSRLSVQPVEERHFKHVLNLAAHN
jgi:predicted RNA-binding protein with PUA-like domain